MSILQEYENIRKEIGEEKYNAIKKYLNSHKDILLSDIYYTREGWAKFEEWYEEKRKLKELQVKLWDLKEDYKTLQEENNRLKIQLECKKEEIEKRDKIIKILDKGYSTFHMTGKFALDFSKEAKTMSYRDMQILHITLDNIIKEVK